MPSHPAIRPLPDALATVDRIARSLARSGRLSSADTDDFVQSVHLRMVESGYRLLTGFEGRSSFRTYLTVVIRRLLLDWLNREYGRWRPCRAAVRLGKVGVALDRLLNRDGFTLDEAVGMLTTTSGLPEDAIRRMAHGLPRRLRQRTVPLEGLAEHLMPAVDPGREAERRNEAAAVRSAVVHALRGLDDADARLLRARLSGRVTVASVARQRNEAPRLVYQRLDRIKRALRRRVAAR